MWSLDLDRDRNVVFGFSGLSAAIGIGITIVSAIVIYTSASPSPGTLLVPPALGSLTVTVSLGAIYLAGYNDLATQLNTVKEAKARVTGVLSRRGITIEDLRSLASEAAVYEKETHIGIAKGRNQSSPFSLGGFAVEAVPDLHFIATYLKTQDEISNFEKQFQTAWVSWAGAAKDYEDTRSTFPHLVVAWVTHKIVAGRFPKAFERE